MTTQLYHVDLSPTEHSALVFLHYIGSTMARAIKNGNATPAQKTMLYKEWIQLLSQVEPALQRQTHKVALH